MSNVKDFLKRKDIVITPQRYLIEALGAMAQGLFASLLIGTIIKTLGQQTGLDVLVDLGGYATAMSGPAMACAIGWALHCPPLVLFSLITVGYSANALGGAGGPLAVLIIAIVASELGKAVSKETRVDILVTPLVTIFSGVGLSMLIAAPIGAAASQVGTLIMWATEQAPLIMGILVSVIVGVTNIIPFFGPFLGAIPSFFLILLVNPIQSLYFLLFVLALQQLDGNVIGPKILGDSTGLSSLWVIIAILVGGSFFGVAGMFFGVPVCACLSSLVAFLVDRRLAEKDLPVETEHYTAPLPDGRMPETPEKGEKP